MLGFEHVVMLSGRRAESPGATAVAAIYQSAGTATSAVTMPRSHEPAIIRTVARRRRRYVDSETAAMAGRRPLRRVIALRRTVLGEGFILEIPRLRDLA